jgi:hypothetical protein
VRAYSNKWNFIRIQQSVEVRSGDIENLRRLLRGEQGIVRDQRDRPTILQVLKDFPQYRVDLYRNILGNAITSIGFSVLPCRRTVFCDFRVSEIRRT